MDKLVSSSSKRFKSLLDEVATDAFVLHAPVGESVDTEEPDTFNLGPSVGDDAQPGHTSVTALGPSVGDDTQPGLTSVTTLGPSVGDDFTQPSVPAVTVLGPSVGDDTFSDLRLKHDVHCVGTTVYGLPLYHFKYFGKPETYEGVMAQDVLKVMPSAVSLGADGKYRVNYRALGTSMRQVC